MTTIRPERPGDEPAIRNVLVDAFPTDVEGRLVELLREAGHLPVSLVAEDDGAIVGHVGFSPVTTGAGAIGAGLAPLAVRGSHQRRGIGGMLIASGLSACRDAGFGWVVVLGEPHYYGRFGFRPAPGVGLADEYGGGDAFQVVELTPGALPVGAGLVRYAEEFASLEG